MADEKRGPTPHQLQFTGSEPELVPGAIYGIRGFRYKYDPAKRNHLYGHFDLTHPWSRGVNVAKCLAKREQVQMYFTAPDVTREIDIDQHTGFAFYPLPEEPEPEQNLQDLLRRYPNEPVLRAVSDMIEGGLWEFEYMVYAPMYSFYHSTQHNVKKVTSSETRVVVTLTKTGNPPADVAPGCTCGYYAYTHDDAIATVQSAPSTNVIAVVRGSGLATVGTRGFRVERSEILAMWTNPLSQALVSLKRITMIHDLMQEYGPVYQDNVETAAALIRKDHPEAWDQLSEVFHVYLGDMPE